MDEPRFYQKPWFYLFNWSVFLGGIYLWHIWRTGGIAVNLINLIVDAVLFFMGLMLWLAFFAQFVLPVRTLRERQKIFDRLLAYLSGGHGPSIFIENGRIRERQGESKKKGPGVLWLDSASAAVTRTASSFKQAIGPGVHFTQSGEFLASTVDLHPQVQVLGPRETEQPFAAKTDTQSDEEFEQIQRRRLEVSALTRDGIEVVPSVRVEFKIDAAAIQGNQPGSHFGYDAEAVRRAITGEGINPSAPGDAPRRRVAWNQLPALVAVDLWREYLSKFTLAQLFEASQPLPPRGETPSTIEPDATRALFEPLIPSSGLEKFLARILHEINLTLTFWGDKCEKLDRKSEYIHESRFDDFIKPDDLGETEQETALQSINRMVLARMSESEVLVMDASGVFGERTEASPEYELLKSRGVAIRSVSIHNLHFPASVEDQLVRQWSTSWLENAKAERSRIERLRGYKELEGRAEAANDYTLTLARYLLRHQPEKGDIKGCLKTLLLRTREALVKNDQFHRRASSEREELEEIIQWLERNTS
jgi:hypothetical protein